MASQLIVLGTTDLAKILRASRFALNRLILQCKIESSISSRSVSGRERLFTIEDAANLSLAYWLFRAGLHMGAVREFLAVPRLAEFRQRLTSLESIEAEAIRTPLLVCWGEPTGRKKSGQKKVRGYEVTRNVALCRDIAAVERTVQDVKQPAFVVIPLGRVLKELAEKIRSFVTETRVR